LHGKSSTMTNCSLLAVGCRKWNATPKPEARSQKREAGSRLNACFYAQFGS
jgi:hypothetical protein